MTFKPLLIFDFDGVIVDGLVEYWDSARKACLQMPGVKKVESTLPIEVPEAFRILRPWVNDGWEMVLLAAEFSRPDSSLNTQGAQSFSENYHQLCNQALQEWQWSSEQLQEALDSIRKEEITNNFEKWLANASEEFASLDSEIMLAKAD